MASGRRPFRRPANWGRLPPLSRWGSDGAAGGKRERKPTHPKEAAAGAEGPSRRGSRALTWITPVLEPRTHGRHRCTARQRPGTFPAPTACQRRCGNSALGAHERIRTSEGILDGVAGTPARSARDRRRDQRIRAGTLLSLARPPSRVGRGAAEGEACAATCKKRSQSW